MTEKLLDLINSPYFSKWLLGLAVTALTGLSGFVMKKFIETVKDKVKQFEDGISTISSKVDLAVSNHLHTIQDNTTETNVILRDISKSQSELVGYLRAKAEDNRL